MLKLMLIGKQRAGKDTVAKYLKEKYHIAPFALSLGVYEVARTYFGMQEKDRELLIKVGEKLREIDPLVWVRHTLETIEKANLKEAEGIVITDVRMTHELAKLLEEGYIPIYIYASIQVRAQREGYTPEFEWDSTEPSEAVFKSLCHFYIDNSGTIEKLHKQVDMIMWNVL